MDGELQAGEVMLSERWRRNMRRQIVRTADGLLLKRYRIPAGARRIDRPWVAEDRALRRLEGVGFPRSYGVEVHPFAGGMQAELRREFVPGDPVETLTPDDAACLGRQLALMHRRRVVTDDAGIQNLIRRGPGDVVFIDFGRARLFRWDGPHLWLWIGRELAKCERETLKFDAALAAAFLAGYGFDRMPVWRRAAIRMGWGISSAVRRWRKKTGAGRAVFALWKPHTAFDGLIRDRYEDGWFIVNGEVPYEPKVREFIVSRAFLGTPITRELHTRNKRNRVRELRIAGVDRDMVMKMTRAAPAYGLGRRIELEVRQCFWDYAWSGFRGALLLRAAGIEAPLPLACWRRRTGFLRGESYLLYEEAEADGTLKDFVGDGREVMGRADQATKERLTDLFADTVCAIWRAGLRYDDVATGNFLVTGAETSEGPRMVVIDTDCVTRTLFRLRGIRKFFELKDTRRLNLPADLRSRFLARVVGTRCADRWMKVHRFWAWGGNKPVRTLLRMLLGKNRH